MQVKSLSVKRKRIKRNNTAILEGLKSKKASKKFISLELINFKDLKTLKKLKKLSTLKIAASNEKNVKNNKK